MSKGQRQKQRLKYTFLWSQNLQEEKPEFQNNTTEKQTLRGGERGEGSKSELSL